MVIVADFGYRLHNLIFFYYWIVHYTMYKNLKRTMKKSNKHITSRNHPVHIYLIKVDVSNRLEQRSGFLWTAQLVACYSFRCHCICRPQTKRAAAVRTRRSVTAKSTARPRSIPGTLHISTTSHPTRRNPHFTRDRIFALAQTLRIVS